MKVLFSPSPTCLHQLQSMICLAGTGWEPGVVAVMDWPGAGTRTSLLGIMSQSPLLHWQRGEARQCLQKAVSQSS